MKCLLNVNSGIFQVTLDNFLSTREVTELYVFLCFLLYHLSRIYLFIYYIFSAPLTMESIKNCDIVTFVLNDVLFSLLGFKCKYKVRCFLHVIRLYNLQ